MVKCQYYKNLQYHAKLYGSVAFIYSDQIFKRLNHSGLFISNLVGGGGGEGDEDRDGWYSEKLTTGRHRRPFLDLKLAIEDFLKLELFPVDFIGKRNFK